MMVSGRWSPSVIGLVSLSKCALVIMHLPLVQLLYNVAFSLKEASLWKAAFFR